VITDAHELILFRVLRAKTQITSAAVMVNLWFARHTPQSLNRDFPEADFDEAADAADAFACSVQAASQIRGIVRLKKIRASAYDKLNREPGRYGEIGDYQ